MLLSTVDVMTWRHDVVTSSWHVKLYQALCHLKITVETFEVEIAPVRAFHVMLTSCRNVMTSWRHFVTCKTISGANQHINLIPNLFSGFYYIGRSLGHFATCCRQPLTSWHNVMTSSWHVKLFQVLFNIETWLQIQFVMTFENYSWNIWSWNSTSKSFPCHADVM